MIKKQKTEKLIKKYFQLLVFDPYSFYLNTNEKITKTVNTDIAH
jgi:hypothetical protein